MCDMASVVRFLCVCLCVSVVTCQFGFFPQREERRYATYQFSPNLNTIRDRLTGILQLRPENQNSDRRFIFPFQNTGIANQNQRPQFQNQNRQPQYIQNYPNQNQQNQYYQNYGQYQNNQNGNGFVSFPQQPNNFIENPDNSNGQNQGNFNEQNQFEPKSVDDSTVMFGEENTGANGIPNGIPNVPPNGIPSEPPNGFPNQPFNGIPNQPPNGIPNEPPNGFPNQPPNGIPNEPPNGIPSQPPNGIPSELPKTPLSPLSDPVTALAPLAPVPEAEKRNNFNFGPAGIFSEICQTVEQKPGNCINIIKCQPYIRILQDSRNNPRAVQILRRAHCGFEGNNPKVCCPLQGIPNTPAPVVTTTTTTTTTTVAPNPEPSGKGTSEDFVPYFPEPPECGVSNASFSRVVGGVKAKLGDFPWMALLGYKSRHGPGARWLCGGSLISSKHVLTAAHCIHGRENDLFVVRLGELDLESETEGATPTDVLIKEKIKHEQYSATAFTNDIGILVLDRTITFTELIKPICIPKQVSLRSMTFENYNPIIAGWGDTEFRGPSATHLMALQLPVVSNSYCAQAYSAYKAQTIDDRVLCAGYKQGGRDACQGDSGGPLMQPIYDEVNYLTHFYQIGVVSYGRKCAEAGFPGVYSRVTHFVPWLAEKVLGQAQS